MTASASLQIQIWPIDRLVFYARNPRKNEAAVDRMCSSIREFGFKVPVLARSDGEVVDGHLRLKAARKLGSWPGGDTTALPVILCDEWTPQQVKAFRLMVNRSVTWADWDEELLSLELRLYIAGQTPNSIVAIANLKEICENQLKDKYRIEVIDLLKKPHLAKGDQIVAIPTLVRRLPPPVKKIVGNLAKTERALVGLDIQRAR